MSDIDEFIRQCETMFNASYIRIIKSDLPENKKAYFIERLFRNKELIEKELDRKIEVDVSERR